MNVLGYNFIIKKNKIKRNPQAHYRSANLELMNL